MMRRGVGIIYALGFAVSRSRPVSPRPPFDAGPELTRPTACTLSVPINSVSADPENINSHII